MFRGVDQHAIDDKGRLSLPARHRQQLGETVIVWRALDGQLNVYPVKAWEEVAETAEQLNQLEKNVRRAMRILYTITECDVDRQGRILIPPSFRAYAGLDTNVVIVGVRDHLEIWSEERFEQEWKELAADGSDIMEPLAGSGLRM